ncbi:TAXI family TRAP transporter solute-binding subunit [Mesobaculum littorinae]|uniref:TAXI family TRAP transporter solute-binding subunit n=1 Tax=Mesobaculum littorinae TaxID=2486419 RepID=UPI001F26E912|nr:TAXI family TRAP transporter solute-binding subunit [Mesobaculum littorinae]
MRRADRPPAQAQDVYRITTAFWEGAEAQRGTTQWLRNVALDTAFTDFNTPLHPGALRYYEEIGMTVPDALRPAD